MASRVTSHDHEGEGSNEYAEYDEIIEALFRFDQKRAQSGNAKFEIVSQALRMVRDELGKERSFLAVGTPPTKLRAAETLADTLKAYNSLNREEIEMDRRDLDAGQVARARKRPKG